MGPAAYWGLRVRALSSQLWTQEAQGVQRQPFEDEGREAGISPLPLLHSGHHRQQARLS